MSHYDDAQYAWWAWTSWNYDEPYSMALRGAEIIFGPLGQVLAERLQGDLWSFTGGVTLRPARGETLPERSTILIHGGPWNHHSISALACAAIEHGAAGFAPALTVYVNGWRVFSPSRVLAGADQFVRACAFDGVDADALEAQQCGMLRGFDRTDRMLDELAFQPWAAPLLDFLTTHYPVRGREVAPSKGGAPAILYQQENDRLRRQEVVRHIEARQLPALHWNQRCADAEEVVTSERFQALHHLVGVNPYLFPVPENEHVL